MKTNFKKKLLLILSIILAIYKGNSIVILSYFLEFSFTFSVNHSVMCIIKGVRKIQCKLFLKNVLKW